MDGVAATVLVGAFSAVALILSTLLPTLANRSQVAFIQTLQAQLKGERDARSALETRVDSLEKRDDAKDLRIAEVTEWGRWATDPVPRTPPEWLWRPE